MVIKCTSCEMKFDSHILAVEHTKDAAHENFMIEEGSVNGYMNLGTRERKRYDPLITVKSKTEKVKNPYLQFWEGGSQINQEEEEELRKFISNVNDVLPIAYLGLMDTLDSIARNYKEQIWQDIVTEDIGYDVYLTFSGNGVELRLTSDGLNSIYRDDDDNFAFSYIGEFHSDYIERGGKRSLKRFNQRGAKLKFDYLSRQLK